MSETRRRILARRAGFIATALAAALPDAGCKKEPPPEEDVVHPNACLKVGSSSGGKGGKSSQPQQDPDEVEIPPNACLKVGKPSDGKGGKQPDAGVADGTPPDAK